MMSDRQIKISHQAVSSTEPNTKKVRLMATHANRFKHARNNVKRKHLAEVVTLKANKVTLKANTGPVKPRLPESIRLGAYEVDQIPYIEQLGWVLVYLLKRYPELKQTQGFKDGHIHGEEHVLRQGLFERHVFSCIDVGCENSLQKNISMSVVYGRVDEKKTCWAVEVMADGGLVRRYICDTQDQVVTKLDQLFHQYGLTRVAWEQAHQAG